MAIKERCFFLREWRTMQCLKRESAVINLDDRFGRGAKPSESLLRSGVFEDEQE